MSNQQVRWFTKVYTPKVNVLITEVWISHEFDPHHSPPPSKMRKYRAIWDTGATNTVINKKVIRQCGLKTIGIVRTRSVSSISLSNVYLVSLGLPSGIGISNLRVTEGDLGDDADVLIGMDIINAGDFVITNAKGETRFTFQFPSIGKIDFQKQHYAISQS